MNEASLRNLKPHKKGDKGTSPGRPTKENTYSDIAREILSAKELDITINLGNGKQKSIHLDSDKTIRHAIIAAQIIEALKGNVNACKDLIDRADGKPPIQIDGLNNQQVTILIQENVIGELPEQHERKAIDATSKDQPA